MTSRSKTQSGSNAKTLLIWLAGAIAVIGLVAVVVSGGTSSGSDHPDLQGAPVATGDNLAPLVTGQQDTELGKPIPEVRGADFDGTPVTIEKNGKAKMIIFLAHWCPNCQAEVPEVVDWLAENEAPADVEILTVATSISRTRDNFPPSEWLDRENWTLPVILDSTSSEVGVAFGASAFPMWAMVDADGNLVARITGAGQVDLTLWTTALSSL
jgi:thiol-disulfide isomerase/thioredoxin